MVRWNTHQVEEAAEEEIFSVGELNARIKSLLENHFPPIWVRGEVSNLRVQRSGHAYFSLKDADSQVSCVLFRGNAQQLRIDLRDGMELLVLGEVSVYEPRGTYQLIVRHALESGEGRLQAEFERLKKRLEQEGLFAPESKKPIPRVPSRIAVLTSPTGAAWQDFQRILQRRGWTGHLTLIPVLVQGAGSAGDLVRWLDWLGETKHFDLVVLTRGGGSLEDLWSFNEEKTVRAVARCPLPLISAVGHEIDFTLTDFAADYRAETPSGAAEMISSGWLDWREAVEQARERLERLAQQRLGTERDRLATRGARLAGQSPRQRLENAFLRLDDRYGELRQHVRKQLDQKEKQLRELDQRRRSLHPQQSIDWEREKLSPLNDRMRRVLSRELPYRRERLETLRNRLRSLHVDQTLRRGFVMARSETGEILSRAEQLEKNQRLTLHFQDGDRNVRVD